VYKRQVPSGPNNTTIIYEANKRDVNDALNQGGGPTKPKRQD
jgi:hypothetical protein